MRKKLLKNRSVRVKMTLMLIIIMTSVILLSVLINLTMLKTYYTVKEKKTIKESYYQIQKVFQKDTVRKNDVDEIAESLHRLCILQYQHNSEYSITAVFQRIIFIIIKADRKSVV